VLADFDVAAAIAREASDACNLSWPLSPERLRSYFAEISSVRYSE
jgi:hypothetical protein